MYLSKMPLNESQLETPLCGEEQIVVIERISLCESSSQVLFSFQPTMLLEIFLLVLTRFSEY